MGVVLAQLLMILKDEYNSNHSFVMLNFIVKLNYCKIMDKKEMLWCSKVLWILKSADVRLYQIIIFDLKLVS